MEIIPYTKHCIGQEEEAAVLEVLRSGYLTNGPKVEEFEEKFRAYIGCKYAIAVSSCSAALYLAGLACGFNKEEEMDYRFFSRRRISTSPLTYVATVNAIILSGGTPCFIDIDKDTWLSKDSTVPVHYAGIVDHFPNAIIEDAAHSCGAEIDGKKVGAKGTCCFSFHPAKNMTTGEGGMVTTDNEEIAIKIKRMRQNGIEKDGFNQRMFDFGFKFNMNEIQAAIGIVQSLKLDGMNARRKQIYEKYKDELNDSVGFQKIPDGVKPSHHIIPVLVENRDKILERLKANGIISAIHYYPVHLMPYYQQKCGYKRGDFPNAEYVGDHVISLPCYPDLSVQDQNRVIKIMKEAV